MWNHLVSQKTWQNDEEDKCNVRSAKRGERRGEGEANIENNVQACNLKSSAQKVSQHRLRDLNLEAQIVPKCFPKRPLQTLWTHLGQPLGDLGAPGMLFGAPRELVGAPRELFGYSGDGFRSSWGRFWEHFGIDLKALFLSLLRVLWKPASSSVLVVLGTFWLTSFAKFAKWQGSLPTRKYQLNCNIFSDARACEHQWNQTKTVLGRAPNSHEIPNETW